MAGQAGQAWHGRAGSVRFRLGAAWQGRHGRQGTAGQAGLGVAGLGVAGQARHIKRNGEHNGVRKT